ALLLTGELIEGDDVPVADKTEAAVGVVDEELGDSDLAAGDEHAVGRELREDVRLASPLRAKLDKVVVALDERDQPYELDELVSPAEQLGVESDGLDQQVDPIVRGELAPGCGVGVELEVGELDRLQRAEL